MIDSEKLAGKTLFVGITAAAIRRTFSIPDMASGVMSGVEIHANTVTTHPYQHRAVPKRPFEWRPADCIPDLPWSAGNWRCGNR
ncbi:CHASE2 domain-containing protein, partial [Thiolapillus sp.]|uniref:CHASE2 domain-containing protein n=1 Tax=Thiolapillus sp. TaxID=2017437 RepID=UPI003AF748E6